MNVWEGICKARLWNMQQAAQTCATEQDRGDGGMGGAKVYILFVMEIHFERGHCTADPSLRFGKRFRRLEGDLAYQRDMRSELCSPRDRQT